MCTLFVTIQFSSSVTLGIGIFLSVSSPFGLTLIFDSTDIHLPYKMNCDDFVDHFTFHIVPPADQCLIIQ